MSAAPTADVASYREVLLGLAAELEALATEPALAAALGLGALLDPATVEYLDGRLRVARRAALLELRARLGTQYQVARALGTSEASVSRALRAA